MVNWSSLLPCCFQLNTKKNKWSRRKITTFFDSYAMNGEQRTSVAPNINWKFNNVNWRTGYGKRNKGFILWHTAYAISTFIQSPLLHHAADTLLLGKQNTNALAHTWNTTFTANLFELKTNWLNTKMRKKWKMKEKKISTDSIASTEPTMS